MAEGKGRREQSGSFPLSHGSSRSSLFFPRRPSWGRGGMCTPIFLPRRSAYVPGLCTQVETMRKHHVLGQTTFRIDCTEQLKECRNYIRNLYLKLLNRHAQPGLINFALADPSALKAIPPGYLPHFIQVCSNAIITERMSLTILCE